MKDYGLVSIITPAYNSSRFISAMIHSVLNQSYANWELLITDDCSTDNTAEIVKAFAESDPRIYYYCLDQNSGAGVARNHSIELAKGRFVAFLDADDKWMPNKLEIQLQHMAKNNCALSYGSYMIIDEKDEITGMFVAPFKHTFSDNKKDDKMGFLTVVYDTSKVGKVFLPTLRKRQDWGLVLKVLSTCRVACGVKQPIGYYRKGQTSLSKNKWSLISYNIAVYREVLKWSKLHALFYFLFVYMPHYMCKKRLMSQYNK